jgi:hypothetical protein
MKENEKMGIEMEIRLVWQRQVDQGKRPIGCNCSNGQCVLMPLLAADGSIDFVSIDGCKPQRFIVLVNNDNFKAIKEALSQSLILSELELLLKRATHFPGTLNQGELQRAEELIAVADEREERCTIPSCTHKLLNISEPLVCRFHAKGLLHRDPQDW